jgi:hypothetical protein
MVLLANGTVVVWDAVNGPIARFTSQRSVAIAGGGAFCLALSDAGDVRVWADSLGEAPLPPDVVPPGTAVAIAARFTVWVVLLANGSVVAGNSGQTVAWGNGVIEAMPPEVRQGPFVDVCVGNYHAVATRADGSLAVWGTAGARALADTPGAVTLPHSVLRAACGPSDVAVILAPPLPGDHTGLQGR